MPNYEDERKDVIIYVLLRRWRGLCARARTLSMEGCVCVGEFFVWEAVRNWFPWSENKKRTLSVWRARVVVCFGDFIISLVFKSSLAEYTFSRCIMLTHVNSLFACARLRSLCFLLYTIYIPQLTLCQDIYISIFLRSENLLRNRICYVMNHCFYDIIMINL